MLLQRLQRLDMGHDEMAPEERAEYVAEAERWREVIRRMADLEWTPEDHEWLSKRNRSVLELTERGREELKAFESATLLMDARRRTGGRQDVADVHNARELRRHAARVGKPILRIDAFHHKPKDAVDLDVKGMDEEDFAGLVGSLELCEEAPVLLTRNLWVEAGLMNGARGEVKGFVWPQGGDPHSRASRLRAPICTLVEFDEVELGYEDVRKPDGSVERRRRSFFPDDPEKARWVPIYREQSSAKTEEHVSRHQFPLTLAWALTHWKAQGMTLARARVSLGAKTASAVGVGYVAIMRVCHYRHLVFEQDLPEWAAFQELPKSVIYC